AVITPTAGPQPAPAMKLALDLRQTDTLAKQLEKTAETTADVVAARLVTAGQIAGGQLLQQGTLRQILGGTGIAQHDVVTAIDQLPLPVLTPLQLAQGEVAAGNGATDGIRMDCHLVRCQPGHARRRLCLA